MPELADAHIHLFERGYASSFTARPGVTVDEPACFDSLVQEHELQAALVVGYQDKDSRRNNEFLAAINGRHDWLFPVAHHDFTQAMSVEGLAAWHSQKFCGVSLYVFGAENTADLAAIPIECWDWLEHHNWLISVNSKGDDWGAWQPILEQFPQLRVLISHLGLPPKVAQPVPGEAARAAMQPVLDLAAFAGVHVKLSGFYAATDPGHDYPHRAAWPYVQALVDTYTTDRLLWASDFSPCLDWLSYPQTLGVFGHMPFLDTADIKRITGENLLNLLQAVG